VDVEGRVLETRGGVLTLVGGDVLDTYSSTARGITSKYSRLATRGFWNM
jgi:hypothetical protein